MKLLSIYATVFLLILSCQAKNEGSEDTKVAYEQTSTMLIAPPPLPDDYNAQEEQIPLKASRRPKNLEEQAFELTEPDPALPDKVIQHAYIRMQVKDYQTSSDSLKKYIAAFNAIITHSKTDRNNGNLENSLQIRINNDKFNLLIQKLLKESVFLEFNNVSVKDVTEQYVDESSRLRTKKKVEERYLALLAKAKTVKEILAVETELKTFQEDIEAAESAFKYLKNKSTYSTITLDYYQQVAPAISPNKTFGNRLVSALKTGWNSIIKFSLNLISIWPLLLVSTFTGFWLFKYFRKRRLQTT